MATESVTTDTLTLARPESTTPQLWDGAPSWLACKGAHLEDAIDGLCGVLEILDRDERNAVSVEQNAGVSYEPLDASLREQLRLAARSLAFTAKNDLDMVRDIARMKLP